MRPHQWVKNVFVLAPVVFAKELFDFDLFMRAGGAFFVFCLLAGAVYTINDIVDAPADRVHPGEAAASHRLGRGSRRGRPSLRRGAVARGHGRRVLRAARFRAWSRSPTSFSIWPIRSG